MDIAVLKQDNNTADITITLSQDEVQPYLESAANRISQTRQVPGFRPGKTPYTIMKGVVGDDVIYHEAFESIVRATFPKAVAQEKLETVGTPRIELQKLAAGNPLVYKASVDLLPEVTLGDYTALKVHRKKITVTDDEVEKALDGLRKSRGKEKLVERAAVEGDKVEIDFTGYLDKVPVDGATSKTHPVVIGSKQFVPGFEENLVGMKAKDEKEFTVRFPKDYYQASMADKDIEFKVTMQAVYEIELPEANDDFAKGFGPFKDLADLKKRLEENLKEEKQHKERDRYEAALLEKIVEISTVGTLPTGLVDSEVDKMLDELKNGLEEQGMEWDKYLSALKKSVDDLKKEFRPQAEKRLKTALITRNLADAEHITVSDEEVKKEIEDTKKLYQGDAEVEKSLHSPEYFRYLLNVLTSKRVYQYLDDVMGIDEE